MEQALRSSPFDVHVPEAEQPDDMPEEARAPPHPLDQHHLPVRTGDLHDQTGDPGTASDVE
jgi:hypothetical protein